MYNHNPALTALSEALTAYAAAAYADAAAAASRAAAAAPTSRLAQAAATYLARMATAGQVDVYQGGAAFAAFIRAGGNLSLYAALSAALGQIYNQGQELTLLEIGVGDGMALLPALRPTLARIDLVEPSAALLAQTTTALTAYGVAWRAFALPLQAFAAQSEEHWKLVQASFSLQALPPTERRASLAWLRGRTPRLLIAEFDVPELGEGLTAQRIAYFAERYETGLAEYIDDGGLVAQGFLMPVFFGAFDPTVARVNYEQPISAWEADLRQAGFSSVTRRLLSNYWWAPAYLLDAT